MGRLIGEYWDPYYGHAMVKCLRLTQPPAVSDENLNAGMSQDVILRQPILEQHFVDVHVEGGIVKLPNHSQVYVSERFDDLVPLQRTHFGLAQVGTHREVNHSFH
jgi:hypothetical protein